MASARQRFLDADDEEELMALQEQMEKSQATPAATVKRIQRKTTEDPPHKKVEEEHVHSCTDPHCSHDHNHSNSHGAPASTSTPSVDDLMAAMQNAMKGIVGEVQERTVIATEPPRPPAAPSAAAGSSSTAAFPAAVHRKQSKFSLALQGKEVHSTAKRVSFGPTTRTAPGGPTAAAPAMRTTTNSNLSEAESIAAETTAVINAMSPEQLEAAREEVLSRLPPSAAEFLRKRGAQKAAAAAAAAEAAVGKGTVEEKGQVDNSIAGTSNGASTSSTKPALAATSSLSKTTKATLAPSTTTPSEQGSHSFHPELSTPPLDSSITIQPSRLRFDVTGNVVSLKPLQLVTNTAVDALEVVSRDPLRQSEAASSSISSDSDAVVSSAAAAEGYTIEEACILARSTVLQQRVFAIRLLRAVLLRAKPTNSVYSSTNGGDTITTTSSESRGHLSTVNLENITSGDDEKENQKPLPTLYWIDIWRHALHDAKVPLVLRVAFDDHHAAVVTAAAEALAVLLSPGAVEREFYTLGNEHPLVCWPMVSLRHMQRPNASGSCWIAAPVDLKARRERKAAAKAAQVAAAAAAGIPFSPEDEDEEEEDDDIDEKELARVDPLTGLLNMELVERIGYVLGTLRPPGATSPLLTILENICYAGQDAAKKVSETDGVLDAVVKVLSEEKTEKEVVAAGDGDILRLQAMRVLRMLCQISPLSARAVATYPGLLASTLFPVILKQQTISSISRQTLHRNPRQQILLEALQIWRCLTLYNFHIGLSFDDAYTSLCLLLNPSLEGGESEEIGQELWEVSREAYYALAEVVAKDLEPEEASSSSSEGGGLWISQKCSSSIAQQTVEWVCSLHLTEFLSRSTLKSEESSGKNAAAVVVMSAVSAALYFLGTYYSTGNTLNSSGEEQEKSRTAVEEFENKKQTALTLLTEAGVLSSEKVPFLVSSALTTCLEGPISTQMHHIMTSYASLALSLSRLEAVLTAGTSTTTTPAGAAAVALAPFTSPAATQRLSQLSTTLDSTLVQPWDMPVMQSCLELSRCIAFAAGVTPTTSVTTSVTVTAAALTALQTLPPGAEDTALQLMAHCFSASEVKLAVDAAFEYLFENKASIAPLIAADGDAANVDAATGSLEAGKLPLKPSAEVVGNVLLAGYAATHLGFVQEEHEEQQEEENNDGDGSGSGSTTTKPSALATLSYSQALLRPETGSTLPLSRLWPLQSSPLPPPGSNVTAPASLATAYALLWSFGVERMLQKTDADNYEETENLSVSEDIKAALLLVFDRSEVEEEAESLEVWREPLVRWTFAAFLQHKIPLLSTFSDTNNSANSSNYIKFTIPEAKRLVDGFSSSSFGDVLYGAAVALLFHKALSPLAVQLDALMSLVDGKSLHLLPCVEICPGDRLNYLDPPLYSASSSSASFSAATVAGSSDAQKEERENKQAVDTYLQILTTPEALKCIETESIAFSVVLHRLAKAIFKYVVGDDQMEESVDEEKKENGSSEKSREIGKLKCRSVLCSAIRRLRASDAQGQGRGLQVLSLLLRWSCKEGKASDVVSAARMEFIQHACATDSTGELLNTVMAALHS